MLDRFLKNGALLISICTALLYLHGSAFYSGYLEGFGIHSSIFPATFERTLVQGYMAYSLMGPKAFLPILGTLVGLLIALNLFPFLRRVLHVIERSRTGSRMAERLSQLEYTLAAWEDGPPPHGFVELTFKIILLFITASAVIGLTIYMFSVSKSIGHANAIVNKAEMAVQIHNPDSTRNFALAYVSYRTKSDQKLSEKRGFIVESTEKVCAVFDGSEVLLIPAEQIQSIRIISK